jgi:hypothetical protein
LKNLDEELYDDSNESLHRILFSRSPRRFHLTVLGIDVQSDLLEIEESDIEIPYCKLDFLNDLFEFDSLGNLWIPQEDVHLCFVEEGLQRRNRLLEFLTDPPRAICGTQSGMWRNGVRFANLFAHQICRETRKILETFLVVFVSLRNRVLLDDPTIVDGNLTFDFYSIIVRGEEGDEAIIACSFLSNMRDSTPAIILHGSFFTQIVSDPTQLLETAGSTIQDTHPIAEISAVEQKLFDFRIVDISPVDEAGTRRPIGRRVPIDFFILDVVLIVSHDTPLEKDS